MSRVFLLCIFIFCGLIGCNEEFQLGNPQPYEIPHTLFKDDEPISIVIKSDEIFLYDGKPESQKSLIMRLLRDETIAEKNIFIYVPCRRFYLIASDLKKELQILGFRKTGIVSAKEEHLGCKQVYN